MKSELKQCTNLIIHNKNYTSFVGSAFVHKMGEVEGDAFSRGCLIQILADRKGA